MFEWLTMLHSRRRRISLVYPLKPLRGVYRYTSTRALWEKLISSDKSFYRSLAFLPPSPPPRIPANRSNLLFSSVFHSRPFNLAPRINGDFSQIIEILRPHSSSRWYGRLKGHKRSAEWDSRKREIERASSLIFLEMHSYSKMRFVNFKNTKKGILFLVSAEIFNKRRSNKMPEFVFPQHISFINRLVETCNSSYKNISDR